MFAQIECMFMCVLVCAVVHASSMKPLITCQKQLLFEEFHTFYLPHATSRVVYQHFSTAADKYFVNNITVFNLFCVCVQFTVTLFA